MKADWDIYRQYSAFSGRLHALGLGGLLALTANLASGADSVPSDWVPMFNGHDLSGWVPMDVAPNTFSVRDGLIVTTGAPTGLLRTERQYEDFEMEIDWRHMKPAGNSGVFVWGDGLPSPGSPFPRGIEVQVLDPGFNINGKNEWYTTHGDVFPVNGATMVPTGRISKTGQRSFPIEDRTKSSPEWNHYHILATNGVIRLSVNGKEVTVGKDCVPCPCRKAGASAETGDVEMRSHSALEWRLFCLEPRVQLGHAHDKHRNAYA